MKNILLIAHDDVGQEARLQAALDVVRATRGHLTCLDICILPAFAGDYDGTAAAMLMASERSREGENRTRLEARLSAEGVPWNWVEATGAIAPCVTQEAALTDLIIVSRHLDGFPLPDMRKTASEIIVRSGRPILAVPEGIRRLDLAGRVLIAWNGSAASGAALRASVPLLAFADAVTIVQIDEGADCDPAEDAAAYLSRHGIHANVRHLSAGGNNPARLLQEEIGREQAAYVVMGGFGRARLSEALFGGVTRTMLTECLVPMFIAH